MIPPHESLWLQETRLDCFAQDSLGLRETLAAMIHLILASFSLIMAIKIWNLFFFCSQSFPGQFGKPQLGVSLAYLVTIHPLALRPRCQKGARMPPLPDSKGRLGSIHRGMICSKGKNLKDLWNLGVFLGIFHGKDFLDYVGFAMNYLFMFG
jgi:hypothetical protein